MYNRNDVIPIGSLIESTPHKAFWVPAVAKWWWVQILIWDKNYLLDVNQRVTLGCIPKLINNMASELDLTSIASLFISGRRKVACDWELPSTPAKLVRIHARWKRYTVGYFILGFKRKKEKNYEWSKMNGRKPFRRQSSSQEYTCF